MTMFENRWILLIMTSIYQNCMHLILILSDQLCVAGNWKVFLIVVWKVVRSNNFEVVERGNIHFS